MQTSERRPNVWRGQIRRSQRGQVIWDRFVQ